MPAAGNKPYQRSMNRSHVLDELRRNPGAARRDIALRLGLDRSTITLITAELIAHGLLEETSVAIGPSGRGRPTVGLRIRDDRLCVLGVSLHARGYEAVVRDNSGTIHARLAGKADLVGVGESALSTLLSTIYRNVEVPLPIVGVGCAIPGSVDPTTPTVLYSRELDLHDLRLAGSIQTDDELTVPVVFDNDARCGAWGELHSRNGATRDLVYVTASKQGQHFGVGLGIVASASVLSGSTHTSGEFYSPTWQGDPSSQFSLSRKDLSRIGGDREVEQQVFTELVRGLVPTVTVLDPETVVFGGFLRERFEELVALARDIPAAAAITPLFEPGRLGTDEITAGAAAMFHEHLFDIPAFAAPDSARSVSWEAVTRIIGAAS